MSKNSSSKITFESLAREVGSDPDEPRIAAVLKTMAKTQPQPHEGDKGKEAKKTKKGGS